MLALREVNARINDLRDITVSQVVRRGDDVDITFEAAPPFVLRLHHVLALHERGVCHARLVSGFVFVPVTRYGRVAAARAAVDAADCVEVWIDDVVPHERVIHRLAAVALDASIVES
ncbi:MAG TPA: hypothetical protein VGQ21_11655 [Thermoanaerobaculia bacterium]|nr:hypothetical protein [Thermoanaerobaculia bacterium]